MTSILYWREIIADEAGGQSVVVDPAWEASKIEQVMDVTACECRAVLLTHSHPDHVHLAQHFAEKHGATVMMSRVEIGYYRFSCANLSPVEDGVAISIGALQIKPILTPGHTAGGMCFLVGDHLFTGDTLFAEGCGMCAGDGADPEALFGSLQELKAMIPHRTRIYPGHSYGNVPGQTFAQILANNIYLNFKSPEEFVAFRMRRGQTGWFNFQ